MAAPEGVLPICLTEVTAKKYGFKTGDGSLDLVDYLWLKREDLLQEIQTNGAISDFYNGKKQIEAFRGPALLFVVDINEKYGEMFLLYHTESSQEAYMSVIKEMEAAIEEQRKAEADAEATRNETESAQQNVVFEDKPLACRPWVSSTSAETEGEVRLTRPQALRDIISIEVTRTKALLKTDCRFSDRISDSGGVTEFRSYKDPNFQRIHENDSGFQIAPMCAEASAQTTWNKAQNKAVQYEAVTMGTDPMTSDAKDELLAFLERVTVRIENALQQNESVDIFHETFRLVGDDETLEGAQADNELRELKNFGDPTYSKSKAVVAIDWMPKTHGLVAVSPVRNISFDQRTQVSGQTNTAYLLLWDFKQLVKPQVLLQCQYEVFTFRFNKTTPHLVAGGCSTGQVVLWDITDALAAANRRNNRGTIGQLAPNPDDDDDENNSGPVVPKFVSYVDHSHKKCVAELFWLPPTTQINFRGQLVPNEFLDGNCYQFISIAGDGFVMVWDIRFEQIAADELRHIGRAKHVPTEKASVKEGGQIKPFWAPIFRAHLKRLEGVGELSLCRVAYPGNLKNPPSSKGEVVDTRSHLMIGTEEGDVLFADLSVVRKVVDAAKEEEEEDVDAGREYVRWIANDHSRPVVGFQLSPFFPNILLSVSDWGFNIWKVGDERPLFVSPLSSSYLTAGCWSPTRPAVILVACNDGNILAWDFTDSSFRPSLELKATTPHKLTSMEFLQSSATNSRQQLLAAGDDAGTLHIFEMPRNLVRPVHKEELIMQQFLDRENQRAIYLKESTEAEKEETVLNDRGMSGVIVREIVNPEYAGMSAAEIKAAEIAAAALAAEEALKAEQAILKKEDDDFDKLEAAFLAELGNRQSESAV